MPKNSGNKKLRYFRIIAATIVFCCFILVFFINGIYARFIAAPLLTLQLAPATVKFLHDLTLTSAYGLLAILFLTLIFGRVYCSILCPLGILQDIVIATKRAITKGKPKKYKPGSAVIRYFTLSAVVASFIIATFSLLSFLDPYSIFGRITLLIIKPAAIGSKNFLVEILNRYDIHSLWPDTIPPVTKGAFIITAVFFVGIIILAAFKNRLYCNAVCPVGTVLALINKFSFLKVHIQPDACIECGKCQHLCRSDCIDIENKKIDTSRCINCFDCLAVCPTAAFTYKHKKNEARQTQPNYLRRRLITASVVAGSSAAFIPSFVKASTDNNNAVMPPGAGDMEKFCSTCVGCGLCISVCPERVLKPSLSQYGLKGFLAPVMDYNKGYCSYQCNLCGQICPTGAIAKLSLPEKKLIQAGTVRLRKGRCVVYRKHKDCGACAEACPTGAVYTIKRNGIHYPVTNTDLCTGCGACENICPARPKAITVEALTTQKKIVGPTQTTDTNSSSQKTSTTEDFPF